MIRLIRISLKIFFILINPTILVSGGANRSNSLHRSWYSISVSPSSSSSMFEALTMDDDLRLVLLLPLELLNSDMGDMHDDRPDMEEIPESEWLWLCRGLGESPPSCQDGGGGPPSRLFFHQFDMDLSDLSLLRWRDCCLSLGDVWTLWFSSVLMTVFLVDAPCLWPLDRNSSLLLRGILSDLGCDSLLSFLLFSSILWKKLLRTSLLWPPPDRPRSSTLALVSSFLPPPLLLLSSLAALNLVASAEVKETVWDLTPRNFSQPGASLAAMVAGDSLLGVEAGVFRVGVDDDNLSWSLVSTILALKQKQWNISEYWSLSYPWVLLSWIDSQGGGGGRGSLVLMNWWSWPGWGGGGGDGVHTLPDDDEFLTSVSGEHGGVGSLGFLVLTDLLGAVFFSESSGCNNKERWVLFCY